MGDAWDQGRPLLGGAQRETKGLVPAGDNMAAWPAVTAKQRRSMQLRAILSKNLRLFKRNKKALRQEFWSLYFLALLIGLSFTLQTDTHDPQEAPTYGDGARTRSVTSGYDQMYNMLWNACNRSFTDGGPCFVGFADGDGDCSPALQRLVENVEYCREAQKPVELPPSDPESGNLADQAGAVQCKCIPGRNLSTAPLVAESRVIAAVQFDQSLPDAPGTGSEPIAYNVLLNESVSGWPSYTIPTTGLERFQPPSRGPRDEAEVWMYGVMPLQFQVDAALVTMAGGANTTLSMEASKFPLVKWSESNLGGVMGMPFWLVLVYSYTTMNVIGLLVGEKEKKLKQGMIMIGLDKQVYWMSWMIVLLVRVFITYVPSVIICKLLIFKHTDFSIVAVLYLLYAINTVAMCLLFSTLCQKPQAAVGLSMLFPIFFAAPVFANAGVMSNWKSTGPIPEGANLIMMFFLSPYAFALGNMILLAEENLTDGGRHWSNLMDGSRIHASLGACMLLLVATTAFYLLLTWYLDKVVPTEYESYETDKLFFLRRKYWFPSTVPRGTRMSTRRSESLGLVVDAESGRPQYGTDSARGVEGKGATHLRVTGNSTGVQEVCETMKEPLPTAVSIRNLQKVYGSGSDAVRAVNGLNLDFFEGQITSFLGHNGAGKTTTIQMLTGLFNASGGDATVYGNSIREDMESVRPLIGVCPQENVLWDDPNCSLTVREHLCLFAALRAIGQGQEQDAVVDRALEEVGLKEKEDTLASALSGGMKRKLNVALALIGEPRCVFLDEPTAGVDTEARRDIWELIRRRKEGRCVVLTTHHMDEADFLGDRIAVLSAGKLQVVGSSLFLKEKYNVGYHVNVSVTEGTDRRTVLALVRDAGVPGAEVELRDCDYKSTADEREVAGRRALEDRGAGDLPLLLPPAALEHLPTVVRRLESARDGGKQGVQDFGVSSTSLEEVFLQLKEEDENRKGGEDSDDEPGSPQAQQPINPDFLRAPPSAVTFPRKLKFLLQRQLIQSRRDPKFHCVQIVFPLLMFAMGGVLSTINWGGAGDRGAGLAAGPGAELRRTPPFGLPYLVVDDGDAAAAAALPHLRAWHDDAALRLPAPFNASARADWEWLERRSLENWLMRGALADGNPYPAAVTFNTSAPAPGAPTRDMRYDVAFNTSQVNALPAVAALVHSALLRDAAGAGAAPASAGPLLRPSYLPFPRTEEDKKNDDATAEYLKAAVVPMIITFGLISFPTYTVFFLVQERVCKAKHMMLLLGIRPTEYWTAQLLWNMSSYIVCTVTGGFIILTISGVTQLTHGAWGLAFWLMMVAYGFALNPLAYWLQFQFDDPKTAQGAAQMVLYILFYLLQTLTFVISMPSIGLSYAAQTAIRYLMYTFPPTAFSVGLQRVALSKSDPWLRRAINGDRDMSHSPFAWDNGGAPLCFMLVFGAVMFAAALLTERRQPNDGCCAKRPPPYDGEEGDLENDEAREERARVSRGDAQADCVRVENLRKHFAPKGKEKKGTLAVQDMCLGVQTGECFALLGPNGAGKTTTLAMILREVRPTSGTARIEGRDIADAADDLYQASGMGYCPQANALFDTLSGRQVLRFYSAIRGWPESMLDGPSGYVQYWLNRAGLAPFADRPCGKYSGGNKRKLSTAIAFCGCPSIAVLDEPSAGMDPSARRAMWRLIHQSRQEHAAARPGARAARGCTVFLTTHYMDEADELGSRIGIMGRGQLGLLGTSQHLKARHGSGYSVEVRVADGREVDPVVDFVRQLCPDCAVAERPNAQTAIVTLGVGIPLARLFEEMAARKAEFGVTAYSISQATLDQVFIAFAKRAADTGKSQPELAE